LRIMACPRLSDPFPLFMFVLDHPAFLATHIRLRVILFLGVLWSRCSSVLARTAAAAADDVCAFDLHRSSLGS
jgi:hypothetical protein